MKRIFDNIYLIGSNAVCERLFSLIKNYWTEEKSQLSLHSLKCWLSVKHNFEMTCPEFHKFILSKPELLNRVQSTDKYNKN